MSDEVEFRVKISARTAQWVREEARVRKYAPEHLLQHLISEGAGFLSEYDAFHIPFPWDDD